jgi:hypothetical protein
MSGRNDRDSGWEGLLEDGETILWQGQPDPNIDWRGIASPLSLFGLFFTLFSLGWMIFAGVLLGGTDTPILGLIFALFGLPFLGVGLYLVAGRLIVDAKRRQRTWYTLTTQQAFVAEELFGHRGLKSHPIPEMTTVELVDGVPGDVIFGSVTHNRPPRYAGSRKPRKRLAGSTTERVGFFRIAEARKVWRLLRDRRAALRAILHDIETEGDA